MLLPFHHNEWNDLVHIFATYLSLYVVFEERNEINFVYLVRVCFFGLILSCVFGLYHKLSPLLMEYMSLLVSDLGIMRYQGLTYHSLHLASLSMLLLCSILILKLKNKLSSSEFFIMFIPIFIFGYLTISRAFILTISISLIIFLIFYTKKQKKKLFPLLLSLCMSMFLVAVVFLDVRIPQ